MLATRVLYLVCLEFSLVFCVETKRVELWAGGVRGFQSSGMVSSSFLYPHAICVDPSRPTTRFYVGDQSSVRCIDLPATAAAAGDPSGGTVTCVAGDAQTGTGDGVGAAARFNSISDLICTRDGRTVFVCDTSGFYVRELDVESKVVRTLAGSNLAPVNSEQQLGCPFSVCFDAHTEAIVYIASHCGLLRYDRVTGTNATQRSRPPAHAPSDAVLIAPIIAFDS